MRDCWICGQIVDTTIVTFKVRGNTVCEPCWYADKGSDFSGLPQPVAISDEDDRAHTEDLG